MRISTFIRDLEKIERTHGNLEAKFVNVGPIKIYDVMDFNIGLDNDGKIVCYMGGATIESQYENAQGR